MTGQLRAGPGLEPVTEAAGAHEVNRAGCDTAVTRTLLSLATPHLACVFP